MVKVSTYNVGDLGSIPGSGRFPGEGNGNPLQYSCLENPMDGGAWQATVNGVAKSQTQLSDFTFFLLSFQTLFSASARAGVDDGPYPAPVYTHFLLVIQANSNHSTAGKGFYRYN